MSSLKIIAVIQTSMFKGGKNSTRQINLSKIQKVIVSFCDYTFLVNTNNAEILTPLLK